MSFLTRLLRRPEENPATDPGSASAAELLQRVRMIELRARRLVDDLLLGEYHAVFRGRGLEFDEIRPYTPGDDTRDIDWKTFARSGEPFIRRYKEDRDLTVLFVVDVSASQRTGALAVSKKDVAAELCAVLALAAVRNNDRVGLLLFASEPERYVRPASGSAHVLRVVREVLTAQPATPGTNLGAALEYLTGVHRRRATVFLLSDFLVGGYGRELRAAALRHDIIPIVIREGLDTELPSSGLVRVADPETGDVFDVDASSRHIREAYAHHVREIDEERRLLFGELGMNAIEITVDEDYVPPLLRFFRRRAGKRVAS